MVLADKTILITGAGSGIGRALAHELIQRQAKIVAIDLNQDQLSELKNKTGNSTVGIHTLDITDKEAVFRLPKMLRKEQLEIDGLINCAGIIQPFVRVNDIGFDDVEHVMNVNFYGALYMTKAFLPLMLKRPEAHIVNISSMGGFLPVPGQSIYGASKAAVKLMTEGLFAELLDTNVSVSVVFPGSTRTNISKNSRVQVPGINKQDQEKLSKSALSAEKAAVIIADGIEKNKPQIFTGKDSSLMNKLYRLSPVLATKLIAKQMKSLLR